MTTEELRLRVLGTPVPQGSKKAFINHKANPPRAVIVDVKSEELMAWRREITTQARNAIGANRHLKMTGPVELHATFIFTRPGYHFGTGRNAHILSSKATHYVHVKPDLDKLLRAVGDALTTAEVYTDDSQVVRLGTVEKRYADHGEPPGVLIVVRPAGTPTLQHRADVLTERLEDGILHTPTTESLF